MKKLILVGLTSLVFATGFAAHTTTVVQKDNDNAKIIIENATSFKTDYPTIKCDTNKRCGNNKKIWWEVDNQHTANAIVVVENLTHVKTGLGIDPLVGPGNDGAHRIDVNRKEKDTLKTRVRKMNEPFVGSYKYDVSVSFDSGSNWINCLDPMIDIDS